MSWAHCVASFSQQDASIFDFCWILYFFILFSIKDGSSPLWPFKMTCDHSAGLISEWWHLEGRGRETGSVEGDQGRLQTYYWIYRLEWNQRPWWFVYRENDCTFSPHGSEEWFPTIWFKSQTLVYVDLFPKSTIHRWKMQMTTNVLEKERNDSI